MLNKKTWKQIRRSIFWALIFIFMLTGCSNEKKVVQEEENIVQDYDEKYGVLSEETGFGKLEMAELTEILDREGIPKIVSAEKVEDDTLYGSMMVLQVQTEDKKAYRLYINQYFHILAIWDVESEDYVYFVTK